MRRIAPLLTLLAAPLTLAALSTGAAGGPIFSPAGPSPAAAADAGLDGKKIFLAEQCNLCHSVESAGIEAKTKSDKLRGPDLSGVTAKRKADELTKFLRQDATLDGNKHKKAFKGSDEELGAVLGWIIEQQKKASAK